MRTNTEAKIIIITYGFRFSINQFLLFFLLCLNVYINFFIGVRLSADVILLIFDSILSIVGTFRSIDVHLHEFAVDSFQTLMVPYRLRPIQAERGFAAKWVAKMFRYLLSYILTVNPVLICSFSYLLVCTVDYGDNYDVLC